MCDADSSDLAHCRRRKTRCLFIEDDFEQRCGNCVRLGKECVFCPRHQQDPIAAQSRFSDKVDGAPIMLSLYSHFSSEMNSGGPFDRAAQSQSVPRPSNAPFVLQGLPSAPGSSLPGSPARRTSDCHIGAILPFGSRQNTAEDRENRHAAIQPPTNQKVPTSQPLWMVLLDQKHPLAFHTQVSASATSSTGQQGMREQECSGTTCHQRQDQDERNSDEGETRNIHARLSKIRSCCQNAFRLQLRIEGQLYKRRLKSLPYREAAMLISRSRDFTSTFSDSPKDTWFATICPYDSSGDSTLSVHENTLPADLWAIECLARLPSSCVIEVQCPRYTSALFAHLRASRKAVDTSLSSPSVRSYIVCLRKLLIVGWHEDFILGPTRIDVNWLFVDRVPETALLTMSQWIAQIISTFEVLGVPEKLGLTVLYNRYFRVCLGLLSLAILANWI
jgi:hypothetical protein